MSIGPNSCAIALGKKMMVATATSSNPIDGIGPP